MFKCPNCEEEYLRTEFKCSSCGEVFWQSRKAFENYLKKNGQKETTKKYIETKKDTKEYKFGICPHCKKQVVFAKKFNLVMHDFELTSYFCNICHKFLHDNPIGTLICGLASLVGGGLLSYYVVSNSLVSSPGFAGEIAFFFGLLSILYGFRATLAGIWAVITRSSIKRGSRSKSD